MPALCWGTEQKLSRNTVKACPWKTLLNKARTIITFHAFFPPFPPSPAFAMHANLSRPAGRIQAKENTSLPALSHLAAVVLDLLQLPDTGWFLLCTTSKQLIKFAEVSTLLPAFPAEMPVSVNFPLLCIDSVSQLSWVIRCFMDIMISQFANSIHFM